MNYGVRGLLLAACWSCTGAAIAGAPALKEDCRDRSSHPVQIRYETSAPVFAEARQTGSAPPVIVINPEVYFVGRETQQWLYERQCVHIQRGHAIVRLGEKALALPDEEIADCSGMAAVAATSSSSRSLRASIESDIQRVTRDNKWRTLLPGPQRRILFDKCPG